MPHDPTDEAHQPHEKHVQPGTDLERDDRTEIPEHLKDALWGDACTVDEYAEQLAELAGADPLELATHAAHMSERGIRA